MRPPEVQTGYSHPSCYLRGTNDCSEQISREHYISRSVLEQLGEVIRISGTPWLRAGETLDTKIGSLTAKILCKRHNEALSPLDSEAGHFFACLIKVLVDLERKSYSTKLSYHLISGEALELWMLKVACGLYFAVGSKDGVRIAEKYTIDIDKVTRAFFERKWDDRAGLYFQGSTGSVVTVNQNVGISPLTMDHKSKFGGAVVSFLGFAMHFIFDTKDTSPHPWVGFVARPAELVLQGPRRHTLILTWPPFTPTMAVVLQIGPPPGTA